MFWRWDFDGKGKSGLISWCILYHFLQIHTGPQTHENQVTASPRVLRRVLTEHNQEDSCIALRKATLMPFAVFTCFIWSYLIPFICIVQFHIEFCSFLFCTIQHWAQGFCKGLWEVSSFPGRNGSSKVLVSFSWGQVSPKFPPAFPLSFVRKLFLEILCARFFRRFLECSFLPLVPLAPDRYAQV